MSQGNIIFEKIQQIDTWGLVFVNKTLANPLFDTVMPWLRESIIWLPLYLYLVVWGLMNMGKRKWWWVFSAILSVAISDQISSGFIKTTVQRMRPCKDPEVLPQIILRLDQCSGAFSFTSSHAANHFSLAMFVFVSLWPVVSHTITRWLFVWAGLICLAQVYVGVHYPLDIFFGSLVGLGSGWLAAKIFQRASPIKSIT